MEWKTMEYPHDFGRLCAKPLHCMAALTLALLTVVPICAQQAGAAAGNGFVNTLMPLPSTVEGKAGNLRISGSFSYAVQGKGGALVSDGAVRLLDRLQMRTGVSLAKEPAAEGQDATLKIDVAEATKGAVPALGDDESYTLDVDAQHVALHAQTGIGTLRGMETLLQLAQPDGDGFVFPAVHIEDAPRFAWRGLMLDSGRHFLPVAVIYRTLDGMAAVKLNVLHWHLTEDQGFRIESKVFPKLQGMGSDGLYYTQEQVKAIVAYASARGIRVVPEFDMPGHSTSWMVGYPELGSAPGPYSVQHVFGIHDAALNPISERTYRFLDAFLGEMGTLFPDAYMHVGGDESNGKQWRANPQIKAFMDAHGMKRTQDLQAYFNTRVEKILARHHKQMVGWDEVLNPAISPDVVIHVWHGNEFLVNAARQGHRGFYSQPYYLDHMYTAAQIFQTDPIPAGANLTADQLKLILGGEACMWGEHISPLTIDSRVWPRAAVVAERLWSPAADRDTDDMYRRLAVESVRLDAEGITHISGPERGLRQLAGTEQDGALRLFASTLQPVDFGERYREQHTSQLTALDRLVDALRPDPPLRREVETLVNGVLGGDANDRQKLESIFHAWVDAAPDLDRPEAGSPLLQEDANRIAAWPKLGAMGIDALGYLRSGSTAPAGWKAAQTALLAEAAKPQELVNFVVLGSLGKLVAAVKEGDPIASYLGPLVDNHTVAGEVTLVATKDGTVYRKALGYSDLGAKAPMPENALFWIASVSKPLTATALMMLVDEGKVSLNDPVEKYLPEFKGQMVKETVTSGGQTTTKLVPANHPILVREILSHTSGLPFRSAAQPVPGALDLLSLKDQVHSFAAELLVFQPDTDYRYSNEGLDTAARIIEVVSGEPYERFMQERLFDPLGMKDTTFWPNEEQIARLAQSYKLDAQTKDLLKVNVDQLTYPLNDHQHRFPMPAGGLFSTADDLGKFCRMILNGGELDGRRYISASSLHGMTSTENRGLGKTEYGFGWAIEKDGFGHGGAYKNDIDINTATGRVLVFMVQQDGPWGTKDGDAMLPRLKQLANEIVTGQGTAAAVR
jgi:hexosaminidase